MIISDVKINGIRNPVGFRMDTLSCSWKVSDTPSIRPRCASIEIAQDPSFSQILYRKEGESLRQQGEPLLFRPAPRTRCYLRVSVTGDCGDTGVSAPSFFETGKAGEKWLARWIGAAPEESFHPVLRRRFTLSGPVRRAVIYASGVGMFEMYLNGKKAGDEYLTPYVTQYETRIQTLTFPVENLLKNGANTLEILLGKGWYMGLYGLDLKENHYGSRMAAIAELHLDYADGKHEVIITDASWEYHGSTIAQSGIYSGEEINELLWAEKENPWRPVSVIDHPEQEEATRNLSLDHLSDRLSLPVIVKEELAVQEIIRTPAGETVLDFGQNFAGFVSFDADFPKGTRIILECAEILQQGNFYHGNYRDAESRFVYISDGTKKTVRPHFTFFGFRYIKVSGWPGRCRKEDFKGLVLYSDLDRNGWIRTSDPRINRLYENTLWGMKSNFIDLPTDCPQRSERLGWTGDAQVFSPTACFHMDTRAFFHKFICDLMDEQEFLHGGVPNYVPNIGHKNDCSNVWGDIAALLPDVLFRYYGDIRELEYSYPLMHDWVCFIERQDAARGSRNLCDFLFEFGDWLALDGPTPTSMKGSTDEVYIASVYYYRSVQIVRESAERLGKSDDALHFRELERRIRAAILQEYFSPSGRLCIDTQAAYVIALKFGIYIDRRKLIDQFRVRLQKDCNQIRCGFVGAPLLCTVLAEAGLYETAYDFLLKEGFPGWLYTVDLGATTIWERWNSVGPDGTISDTGMNSLNHYAYGSVMEFVYGYAGGIRPLEPGFSRALIDPHPDIRLPEVDCVYDSVSGRYACRTRICADGSMYVRIEIPFGCEAKVILPEYPEGGPAENPGDTPAGGGENAHAIILQTGTYEFTYLPVHDFRKPYGRHTSLGRIAQDEAAVRILATHVPAIAGIASSGDPEMGAHTLEEISQMTYLPFSPDALEEAIRELSDLTVKVC